VIKNEDGRKYEGESGYILGAEDSVVEAGKRQDDKQHKKLLNMIKRAIDRLANDQSVSRRQTMRELVDIREYLQSAVENIRDETSGGTK
jgi:hypothetical protein